MSASGVDKTGWNRSHRDSDGDPDYIPNRKAMRRQVPPNVTPRGVGRRHQNLS